MGWRYAFWHIPRDWRLVRRSTPPGDTEERNEFETAGPNRHCVLPNAVWAHSAAAALPWGNTAEKRDHPMNTRKFCEIWIEQCDAAREIRLRYGRKAAFDYLVAEKLLNFADAAAADPEFARELPRFVARVRGLFTPPEIRTRLDRIERERSQYDADIEEGGFGEEDDLIIESPAAAQGALEPRPGDRCRACRDGFCGRMDHRDGRMGQRPHSWPTVQDALSAHLGANDNRRHREVCRQRMPKLLTFDAGSPKAPISAMTPAWQKKCLRSSTRPELGPL